MTHQRIAKLILFVMLLNVFGNGLAFADEVTDDDSTTATPEKTMQEIADEAKQPVFETGLDPLWSILEVEVDEDIIVGQEFKVKITARNIGTGVAFFPVIEFTEEDDRKALSHFGIIGSTSDTYMTGVQRVESGETKTFTIPMKVDPATKELPEGSSYKINATLKSNNWNIGSGDSQREPAFAVSTSFLLKPRYTLTSPTFVVQDVSFSPEAESGAKNVVATFTIDNISDTKARNVSIALEGVAVSDKNSDKNIKVTDLSTTRRVGDVAGKSSIVVTYNLELNTARKTNEMKLSINYDGLEKTTEEIINLPLPLHNGSINGREPKVIISEYHLSPAKILAGNTVVLSMQITNTNADAVNNVSMKLTVPTSEGNSASGTTISGGTVFSPVNSSNTFYIDSISGKSTVTKEISLYVDPNAQAKTYVVPIEYKYEGIDGESYSGEDNINIPVTQESKVEVINAQLPTMGNVGSPIDYNVEFVNTGKVALTNFKATLEGNIPDAENNVYYIGTFDAAASDSFSGMFFPVEEGTLNGAIVFTYRDADNQEVRYEHPFSIEIAEALPPPEMPDMPFDEPQNSFVDKIKDNLLVVGMGIVIIILAIIIIKDKRKQKADEELMNG